MSIRHRKSYVLIGLGVGAILFLFCALVWFRGIDAVQLSLLRQTIFADVIMVPGDMPESVTITLVIRGDAYSQAKLHYVEHLAWQNAVGKTDRSSDRHSNAWTNDYTVGYWLSGPQEDFQHMLNKLAGVFNPIDLSRNFAEQEREIILREYDLQIANDIDAQAALDMGEFLYMHNAFATSVIGTPEEIMSFDYDTARALHSATHSPENATLVIIGDVTEQQVLVALNELDLPEPQGERIDITSPHFYMGVPSRKTLFYPEPTASARIIWRRVVQLDDPMQFDLLEAHTALLRDILDTNLPGGLGGPLQIDATIARSFDIEIWPIEEHHIEVSFTASPDRNVSLSELRAAFETTLSGLASNGITPKTYDRVHGRFDGFWPDWTDKEETAGWMAGYVLNRVSIARMPLPKRKLKQLKDRLGIDTTNALLRQLAAEGRTAIAFVGPEEIFE